MSPRRVSDWQIKPSEGEKENYDLYLNNRQVLQGRSMTEIGKYLRRHLQDDQTVHEVADDGYVTDRTKRHQRRKRPTSQPSAHKPVRMPFIRF